MRPTSTMDGHLTFFVVCASGFANGRRSTIFHYCRELPSGQLERSTGRAENHDIFAVSPTLVTFDDMLNSDLSPQPHPFTGGG